MAVDETRIAGVVPAICGQHLRCGFWIFVIALEQSSRLDQNFAVVGHLDFDPFARHAHGVGAGFVIGLQAHEHCRFGGAIQLLDVDTD